MIRFLFLECRKRNTFDKIIAGLDIETDQIRHGWVINNEAGEPTDVIEARDGT